MESPRLTRVEDKVDRIWERIASIDATLAGQHEQLKIHIEGVKLARQQNDLLKRDLDSRLQPIQDHVTVVRGVIRVIGYLAAIGGSIEGVSVLLRHL